jgi:hypothetical protein
MYRRSLLLGAFALPVLAGCQTPLDVEETTTLNGVVETIDPRSRELLLRGGSGAQSGMLLSMIASPRVQNLDRMRPGDRVTVRFYQALAANIVRPTAGASPPSAAWTVDRYAPTATRPGGEVTRVVSGRVTVTALDTANNSLTFIGPGGVPRTVFARRPEGRSFLRSLSVGDQVDITYEEALAISIEPMRS